MKTIELEDDNVYVICVTVTVEDLLKPELHPIHRHEVYGVATNQEVAQTILRTAIHRAGFKTTDFDTRLRKQEMSILHTKREYVQGVLEHYEWTVHVMAVDKYVM